MTKKSLFALWGGMFFLCAALGFVPEPAGAGKVLCTVAALIFFLPPARLVYSARKEGDAHTLALVRSLSALSLGLTAVLLVVNFLGAFRSERFGTAVHSMLTIVSSPMICSGHWALSLFLWACLLMASGKKK